jgi:hypothetical protein
MCATIGDASIVIECEARFFLVVAMTQCTDVAIKFGPFCMQARAVRKCGQGYIVTRRYGPRRNRALDALVLAGHRNHGLHALGIRTGSKISHNPAEDAECYILAEVD